MVSIDSDREWTLSQPRFHHGDAVGDELGVVFDVDTGGLVTIVVASLVASSLARNVWVILLLSHVMAFHVPFLKDIDYGTTIAAIVAKSLLISAIEEFLS